MATTRLRERHVDRLLAEEIECSPAFASWFAARAGLRQLPKGLPLQRQAQVGVYRHGGETDVRIMLSWPSGDSVVLHVEDKLDAVPQPRQAERYAIAARAEDHAATCVLFAPRAWARRHPQQASAYDSVVHHEDAADWLRQRATEVQSDPDALAQEAATRLIWRADLLSGARLRAAVRNALEAGDLMDWNVAAAEVIYAFNGLALGVAPRQRSAGAAKDTRFLHFDEPLRPTASAAPVRLKLKTGNNSNPGRVSLELPDGGTEAIVRSARAAGFRVETSPRGRTMMISTTGPRLENLHILRPVREQIEGLQEAAECAQRLAEWWQAGVT